MKNNRISNRLTKKANVLINPDEWSLQIDEIQDYIQLLYNEISDIYDESVDSNEKDKLYKLMTALDEMTKAKESFSDMLQNKF